MKIKESAGIAIILKGNKILMARPRNAKIWERYTPPKGNIEDGESIEKAASRETHEEVGIYISPNVLDRSKMAIIDYDDRRGNIFKRVYLFEHRINTLVEIGLADEILPKSMLQEEEISDARFMDYKECEEKSLKRYIKYIKNKIGIPDEN